MAHLIPSDITKLELKRRNSPELETLDILAAGLPDDYDVFHGVHWTRSYERHTVYGEIDFIIVNKAGDVLLIEQKNGELEEQSEGLWKKYDDRNKNVVCQMHRSLNQIRKKFQYIHKKSFEPDYGLLLYCPDHKVKNINSAGLDADCIVDAARRLELCAVIRNKLPAGFPDKCKSDKVKHFFAQSFNLVLDIHSYESGLNKCYQEMASNLVDVVNNLELTPYKLRVAGTAGSGKSLLAAEFYQRQLEQNRRVLFLCFNRPLMDQLINTLPPGGTINTWYGFLQEVLKDKDLNSTPDGSEEFWNNQLNKLSDLGVGCNWQFDALVIDEGQDFEELWWLFLKEDFLSANASILWLDDPDQNVRGVGWQQREFPATYYAKKNYRSPNLIAKFIQEKLPIEFDPGNSLRGYGVGEHHVEDEKELKEIIDKLVKNWISEGISEQEIVVLTCLGLRRSSVYAYDRLGNREVRKYLSKYSEDGEQMYSPGELRFDSVRRFKGLQASVVILIDVNLSAGEDYQDRMQVVFTGMTRATLGLEVVYSIGQSG